jgi:hypothetical protein
MYWYLRIRSDAAYRGAVPFGRVVDVLAAMPELRQSGHPAMFEAAPGAPWVSVCVALADAEGNYAVRNLDEWVASPVNVVELVCPHGEDAAWYDALAARIARALGWEAVEDSEDRQVWPVKPPNV